MTRICVAGRGGTLGEAFYKRFKDDYALKCTDIDVNEDWLSYLKFRDFDKYQKDVLEFKAHYLIHLGAFTDFDFCGADPDETYVSNPLDVENSVRIANGLNIPILRVRPAGIFGGNKGVYDEWDTPDQLGQLATSKYAGELFV